MYNKTIQSNVQRIRQFGASVSTPAIIAESRSTSSNNNICKTERKQQQQQ